MKIKTILLRRDIFDNRTDVEKCGRGWDNLLKGREIYFSELWPQMTPDELICLWISPFPWPAPSPRGGSGHSRGVLCILHKAQVWTAYTLASTIFKSFKPEDLSWANFPFSLLFFWGKKINYAIVYTLGCIRRRGISVLKEPRCSRGLFSCIWISLWRYVLITHPMECNPHIWSKADRVWVCVLGGLVFAICCFCPIRKVVILFLPWSQKPPRLSSLSELLTV